MTQQAPAYFKILNEDGTCCKGGTGTWKLGRWQRKLTEPLRPCEYGYHVLEAQDLVYWLPAPAIFAVEVHPKAQVSAVRHENKLVVSQARITKCYASWNERTQRLFAADCAEHVLHIFEAKHPNDLRPREAIEAARQYANGQITPELLRAKRNAAADAAYAADNTDAYAAYAAYAAADAYAAAAADAADAAADAAAYAAYAADAYAAVAAARKGERQWQLEKLLSYLNVGEVS